MELSLDRRIRQRAYEIWDAAGRLDGQAEQHWLAAEREVLEQMSAAESTGVYTPRQNREQKQKLTELKASYLANLTKIRQANSSEERDTAIAEHIDSYIAGVGNDHELADAFLTWLNNHVPCG